MVTTHNLGFPRIGANRELKFGLEKYWKGEIDEAELTRLGASLRHANWDSQQGLDYLPVGDFSLYDQVLDMSFTLGNLPARVRGLAGTELDKYFRVARGRSVEAACCVSTHAGEMTKWFDTNYHYIVPEFTAEHVFTLDPTRILSQIAEIKKQGLKCKPVIIGPVTYLWLGKDKDGVDKLTLLDQLLPLYQELLDLFARQSIEWVQIDEPILVTELTLPWQEALRKSYAHLASAKPKILLSTYFGQLKENIALLSQLPVQGVHIDAINAKAEIPEIIDKLSSDTILSLGVINGRNIWKTSLLETLDWLEPIYEQIGDRLWLAPSCSLLHVPVDLRTEKESEHSRLDSEVRDWLAFACQKIEELKTLALGLNRGREAIAEQLAQNTAAIQSRRLSKRVNNTVVRSAVEKIDASYGQRISAYADRAKLQRNILNLPLFPTTTIGSFPQTNEIRNTRLQYREKEIDHAQYLERIKAEISHAVKIQEDLDIDVLVHGEAERNDMVEYFGEQLEGYTFSQFGWVQSYGSRCVKPPILFGDISRPQSMTVQWSRYAQSLTKKPMKGMLTGPVTILNWSFVRDDQDRAISCYQLALAIREEVQDLEDAGLRIIQIDEAALREGLPLRRQQWGNYLTWAIAAFRICANGVKDQTQIHTHMCYSEFNDIIGAIADMDADVITIETSRSDMELLDAFTHFDYPNELGPGVYDIHSPNIPNANDIVALMEMALERIPAQRLWINPDCGLKTRQWDEVIPALESMVSAAKTLRLTRNKAG